MKSSIVEGKSEIITIPNEICYLNSLLDLLSISCEEKNNATENKCQSYFPLENLNFLLEISDECYYIRKNILLFFYHVFLDTEREMNEEDDLIEEISRVFIIKIIHLSLFKRKFFLT